MVKRLYQAVNFLRPLARLLFTMRRPAAVDILLRKPCFLARLILLGWKVLFICNPYFTFGWSWCCHSPYPKAVVWRNSSLQRGRPLHKNSMLQCFYKMALF